MDQRYLAVDPDVVEEDSSSKSERKYVDFGPGVPADVKDPTTVKVIVAF
jgi:hypothetical protein